MGRWIVIISLAIAPCLDMAAAEPPATGVPLPKPRPARRDLQAATLKAVAVPRQAQPVVESAAADPAGPSSAEESPHPADSLPPPAAAPQPHDEDRAASAVVQAPVRTRSGAPKGDCGRGKRMISAYYWEGQRTASGQRFDPHGMTAAHRTLPFGTRLTVLNPRTGKSVMVVINDRGPFVTGVGLDLSLGAAQAIGMRGTGAVCIQ